MMKAKYPDISNGVNTKIKRLIIPIGAILALALGVSVALALPPGWSDDKRVTNDPAFSGFSKMAADASDNLHLVWQDTRDGNAEIYCRKLDQNGNPIIGDTRLTSNPALSWFPAISRDSANNMHVVWLDDRDGNSEIYYTKLDNNCGTLIDDTRLTTEAADSALPGIAVDANNNLHVVWIEGRDGNSEVYYRKFNPSGSPLTPEIRLTTNAAVSWQPAVTADSSGNIHAVWLDDRDGNSEIYYEKLDNNGNTLINDSRLTVNPGDSAYPAISRDPLNNLHIVWLDDRDGNSEIYYRKIDANGSTLVADTRITNDASISWFPTVSSDKSGYAQIVWIDGRDGNPELYYTKLDSRGTAILGNQRLTTEPADSFLPFGITDTYSNMLLSWLDLRDLNEEIYHKRSLRPTLAVSNPNPRPGTQVTFTLSSPLEPNLNYALLMDVAPAPGLPLGDGRIVPLPGTALFIASLDPFFMQAIGFSANVQGALNSQGQTSITWNIPTFVPPGVTLWFDAPTIARDLSNLPYLVTGISNPISITTQ